MRVRACAAGHTLFTHEARVAEVVLCARPRAGEWPLANGAAPLTRSVGHTRYSQVAMPVVSRSAWEAC